MGRYCKAYRLGDLRRFLRWSERSDQARPEEPAVNGDELATPRRLGPDDYLFVHDDHVVTDGVFNDENVIFDTVTLEWVAFCEETLGFRVPDDVPA